MDNDAFAYCKNLVKVEISGSTYFSNHSFFHCDKLKKVIFKGTKEEWEKQKGHLKNSVFRNVKEIVIES